MEHSAIPTNKETPVDKEASQDTTEKNTEETILKERKIEEATVENIVEEKNTEETILKERNTEEATVENIMEEKNTGEAVVESKSTENTNDEDSVSDLGLNTEVRFCIDNILNTLEKSVDDSGESAVKNDVQVEKLDQTDCGHFETMDTVEVRQEPPLSPDNILNTVEKPMDDRDESAVKNDVQVEKPDQTDGGHFEPMDTVEVRKEPPLSPDNILNTVEKSMDDRDESFVKNDVQVEKPDQRDGGHYEPRDTVEVRKEPPLSLLVEENLRMMREGAVSPVSYCSDWEFISNCIDEFVAPMDESTPERPVTPDSDCSDSEMNTMRYLIVQEIDKKSSSKPHHTFLRRRPERSVSPASYCSDDEFQLDLDDLDDTLELAHDSKFLIIPMRKIDKPLKHAKQMGPYKCYFCNRRFMHEEKAERHEKYHARNEILDCVMCHLSYQPAQYATHMFDYHGIRLEAFKHKPGESTTTEHGVEVKEFTGTNRKKPCPQCGELFINVHVHMRRSHGPPSRVKLTPNGQKCPVCGGMYTRVKTHLIQAHPGYSSPITPGRSPFSRRLSSRRVVSPNQEENSEEEDDDQVPRESDEEDDGQVPRESDEDHNSGDDMPMDVGPDGNDEDAETEVGEVEPDEEEKESEADTEDSDSDLPSFAEKLSSASSDRARKSKKQSRHVEEKVGRRPSRKSDEALHIPEKRHRIVLHNENEPRELVVSKKPKIGPKSASRKRKLSQSPADEPPKKTRVLSSPSSGDEPRQDIGALSPRSPSPPKLTKEIATPEKKLSRKRLIGPRCVITKLRNQDLEKSGADLDWVSKPQTPSKSDSEDAPRNVAHGPKPATSEKLVAKPAPRNVTPGPKPATSEKLVAKPGPKPKQPLEQCRICNYRYVSLPIHFSRIHPNEPIYLKDKTNEVSDHESEKSAAAVESDDGEVYDTSSTSENEDEEPEEEEHEDAIPCPDCPCWFADVASLTVHKALHKPGRRSCPVCRGVPKDLASHVDKCARGLIRKVPPPSERTPKKSQAKESKKQKKTPAKLECAECQRTFRHAYQLKEHELTHENDEFHVCDTCDQRFKQPMRLYLHKVQVHGYRSPSVGKPKGKLLGPKSVRQRHVSDDSQNKDHSDTSSIVSSSSKRSDKEKGHRCHQCRKSFKLRRDLISHQETHIEEKPYKCEKCGRGFTFRRYLKVHQQRVKCIKV